MVVGGNSGRIKMRGNPSVNDVFSGARLPTTRVGGERQRLEVRPFGGEQVPPRGVQLATELRVDRAAPDDRLLVGVGKVAKLATVEEVLLHVIEQAFDDRGAIRIALLMRAKREAALLGKRRHLWRWHHVRAGAVIHDHAGVVDHADLAHTTDVVERTVEEKLAFETREAWIQLDIRKARVRQRRPRDLHRSPRTTDVRSMRRGVMLHLPCPAYGRTGQRVLVARGQCHDDGNMP
jgi:hypothetical protein